MGSIAFACSQLGRVRGSTIMLGVALGFSRLFLFLQAIKTEKIDKSNLRFSHFWVVNSNLLSIREDDNLAE